MDEARQKMCEMKLSAQYSLLTQQAVHPGQELDHKRIRLARFDTAICSEFVSTAVEELGII